MSRTWTALDLRSARECLASGWDTADVAEELELSLEDAQDLIKHARCGERAPEAAYTWQTANSLARLLDCAVDTIKFLADDGASGVESHEPAREVLGKVTRYPGRCAYRLIPGCDFVMRRGANRWKVRPEHLPEGVFEWQDAKTMSALLGISAANLSAWRSGLVKKPPKWIEWRQVPDSNRVHHAHQWQYRCKKETP